jgi:hypothetical protein
MYFDNPLHCPERLHKGASLFGARQIGCCQDNARTPAFTNALGALSTRNGGMCGPLLALNS